MILERFVAFAKRLSDFPLFGRNRARIIIGTDRKDTIDSGYGDGGQNDTEENAAIDIVAGFDGSSENMSFENDKSRIYLSAKSNPDEYISNDIGARIEGEAVIIQVSDNIYLKSRNQVKIIGPNYSIILEDGQCKISLSESVEIKAGNNTIKMNESGIEVDAGQGISGKIITDLDSCVGTDPVTGSPIISNFKQPGAIVLNNKVLVK